jgi:hypothetical protein
MESLAQPQKLTVILTTYEVMLQEKFPASICERRRPQGALLLLDRVCHLRWMIHEALGHIRHNQIYRAARWAGYIEGSLVQLGIVPLEEVQMLDIMSS